MDKYYIFHLDEPAAPGFCSFDKMYVGTEKEMMTVASNLEKKDYYEDTVSAIRDYFKGNINAEHNIAYKNRKVLKPVKIEAEHKSSFDNMRWSHTNIWGFPYEMKCDLTILHQIVFRFEGRVYRYIRAWMKNLSYEISKGEWQPLDSKFWGNAAVLDVSTNPGTNDFTFNNLLYVAEEIYDSDLKQAIDDMCNDSKIELQKICDEIFADG